MKNQAHSNLALVLHYAFKMLHPIGGIVSICLGCLLFVFGVTGRASIIVEAKDIQGQLTNAAPGLFFAIGGLIVLGISAWRGAPINSVANNKEIAFMANEAVGCGIGQIAQDPKTQCKSGECTEPNSSHTEEAISGIGPHVSFRRNQKQPHDEKPDAP